MKTDDVDVNDLVPMLIAALADALLIEQQAPAAKSDEQITVYYHKLFIVYYVPASFCTSIFPFPAAKYRLSERKVPKVIKEPVFFGKIF